MLVVTRRLQMFDGRDNNNMASKLSHFLKMMHLIYDRMRNTVSRLPPSDTLELKELWCVILTVCVCVHVYLDSHNTCCHNNNYWSP